MKSKSSRHTNFVCRGRLASRSSAGHLARDAGVERIRRRADCLEPCVDFVADVFEHSHDGLQIRHLWDIGLPEFGEDIVAVLLGNPSALCEQFGEDSTEVPGENRNDFLAVIKHDDAVLFAILANKEGCFGHGGESSIWFDCVSLRSRLVS